MASALSERVTRFLAVNVTNVAQLELLLHLRASADRWWTAEKVAQPLTTRPAVAARDFAHLHERGLVERSEEDRVSYRYAPGALSSVVDEVAEAYARRRTAVVAAIFSDPHDDAVSLAEAFRLRRK